MSEQLVFSPDEVKALGDAYRLLDRVYARHMARQQERQRLIAVLRALRAVLDAGQEAT